MMTPVGSMPWKTVFEAYSLLVAGVVYLAGGIWRALAHRPLRRDAPCWNDRKNARRNIRSILLVRLDEMGDFVLFSSILRPIRQAYPHAHITLVLSDWICPLAKLCPHVNEIVPFPTSGPKWLQYVLGPWRAWRIVRRLGRRFDLAINPRFDRDIRGAAFLAHFSLAPWVLGYPSSTEPFKEAINRGYDRLYSHLLPAPAAEVHEVERSRNILQFLGIPGEGCRPELWLSSEDGQDAQQLLREENWRPGEDLVCLGIHASISRRQWPLESFLQLADRMAFPYDVRFLIVGNQRDREYAERLRPALGSRMINLAGRASLRVSAAALNSCRMYIGNDSGPMHLAAALGKPVVEISCHPEDGDGRHFQAPVRFMAMAKPALVLAPQKALPGCAATCLAGEPHCITQVSVDEVLEAVVSLVEILVPTQRCSHE